MALNPIEVDAAKRHFEENGWKVTVRSLSKFLGRDINAVSDRLRVLNEAEKAMSESKIKLNPATEGMFILDIETAVAQATELSELRAKAAEDALNALAAHVREFDALFMAHSEELAAAQAQVLQCQVQLQERDRENERLRNSLVAAEANAEAQLSKARACIESLRLELATSEQIVKSLIPLKEALKDSQDREKAGQETLALARQSEAVAVVQAKQQEKWANDASEREKKIETQRQRLQDEQKEAQEAHLLTQQKMWQLSTEFVALKALCAEQVLEIAKLREARNDATGTTPDPAPAPHDQRHAA
jgi:chromosome segregation ATPase